MGTRAGGGGRGVVMVIYRSPSHWLVEWEERTLRGALPQTAQSGSVDGLLS